MSGRIPWTLAPQEPRWLLLTGALALIASILLLRAGTFLILAAGAVLALALAYARPFLAFLAYAGTLSLFQAARLRFGESVVPLYFVDIFLGIALLGLFLRPKPLSPAPSRTPLDKLVLVLIVSVLPGFFLLFYRFPSAFQENLYFVIRYFLHMGAFFAASRLITERSRLLVFLKLLYICIIVNGMWAIVQSLPVLQPVGIPISDFLYGLVGIPYEHERPGLVIRAAAGFGSPNGLGGLLAMFLPLALFHPFPRASATARFLVPLVLFFGGLGFLLTFSRTAIAGFAAGLAVSSLALKNLGLLRGKAPLFIAGFALIAWALTSVISPVGDVIVKRASGYADPFEDTDFQARVVGHYRFLGAVAEDPSLLLFGESLRLLELERRSNIPPDTFKGFVSNSWLLVLLDSGLVAFVAYVLVYSRAVLLVWRRIASASRLDIDTSLLVGLLVAFVALFFTHLVDNYMAFSIHMKGIYFAILGVAMAELRLAQPVPRSSQSP